MIKKEGMKKIFPYILIIMIVVQLFAPFTVGSGVKNNLEVRANKAEATDCEIVDESFAPFVHNATEPRPNQITYNMSTSGCLGKSISVSVISSNSLVFNDTPARQISENDFSFLFNTGEKGCGDSSCSKINIRTKILDGQSVIKEWISMDTLIYKCTDGNCNDNKNWEIVSTSSGLQQTAINNCKITKVLFNPMTVIPNNRPEEVTLWINTSDCQGKLMDVKLSAVGGMQGSDNILTIPRSTITLDSASYKLKTGEQYCNSPDCDDIRVHISIIDSINGQSLASYASGGSGTHDRLSYKCTSKNESGKIICDQAKKWQFESSVGGDQTAGSSSTVDVWFFTITEKDKEARNSASFSTEAACIDSKKEFDDNKEDTTTTSNCTKKTISQTQTGNLNDNEGFPACSIWHTSQYVGCIGIGLYYLLFRPTSWFFSGAGKLLDIAVHFSISDTSYRSEFVVEGWGLVRDFCNMFFIFVLLYIAFGTILDLHGVKTKEMIINVIIIGLLINFSLFATQVIIDTSNILTRVFYNPQTIVVGSQEDSNGKVIGELGDSGEIKLSEAIVNKVDPQQIIIRSKDINKISVKNVNDGTQNGTDEGGDISGGTFIIIVLLTTAINIVGIIAFLSSGLIFIARVIGLWFAMILAPLAFFSYIVPSLQDIEMIGWKKWWPDTLKMAFLAPIFMFFMYLLVKFMDKGLGVFSAQGKNGLSFVIAIVIPFVAIMVILMKAKDIAKKMSGTLGQTITNGIAAVGGMALGGAALGTAMLGRKTIGAFMKSASTGESSNQRYAAGASRNRWDAIKGATAHYGTFGLLTAAQKKAGVEINKDQTKVETSRHARHELDQAAGARFNGKKFNELTQPERETIRERISRDHEGRKQFGKAYNDLTAADKATVDTVVTPQLATRTSQADHYVTEALKKQGLLSSVVQSSRNGSYDVRNLSTLIAGEQDRGLNKFATGLTAALASGMRGIFKQTNMNYGTGQKDFIKDLGHTITEALKSTTLKVDLSHVGEEKKEEHGGGGHH